MEPAARKKQILSAIVESYISTGEPVGSKTLINEAGLKVSSATVRNDMAELTERGYIVQPHTSAGAAGSTSSTLCRRTPILPKPCFKTRQIFCRS